MPIYQIFLILFFVENILSHCSYVCRQEMMDLVNKSGKFSKKFDKFTGEFNV